MARNTRRPSWRNVKPSQVLPVWTTNHSNTTNLVAGELLAILGVTDVRSYFRQLRVAIIVCALVGACIGASMGVSSHGDGRGLLIGALLGVVAPAALIFLGTLLVGIVLNLAIFCAVWAVIIYTIFWILGG